MTIAGFQKIGVIGAGQMGAGIAQVCAAFGLDVTLVDLKAEALGKAIKAAQEMHPTATLNGVAEIEIDPDHIWRVAATLPAPASH